MSPQSPQAPATPLDSSTGQGDKPFVDFYNHHNIIPVQQDIRDTEYFTFRRNYLYTTLGMPLARLRGLNVLEFGPGGGFNAVATSAYGPASYVFVDGSKASLAQIEEKRARGLYRAVEVRIEEADFHDYRDARRYDCVICELALPGQRQPGRTLRRMADFCAPGGVMILTTSSASSLLADMCRRVLRPGIVQARDSFEDQVALAETVFASHLEALRTSTRSVQDWVLDNVLHNWTDGQYIFPMTEAAEVLEADFDFYGSSPRFLLDNRWYKQVDQTSPRTNDLLREQYPAVVASFLDYRLPLSAVPDSGDQARLAEVEPLCARACALHDRIIAENSYDRLADFNRVLLDLAAVLPETFAPTRQSLSDFVAAVERFAMGDQAADFAAFKGWWGRGQQYVSFLKRP